MRRSASEEGLSKSKTQAVKACTTVYLCAIYNFEFNPVMKGELRLKLHFAHELRPGLKKALDALRPTYKLVKLVFAIKIMVGYKIKQTSSLIY